MTVIEVPASMLPPMVRLGGGSFLMGSIDGRDDERPVHRVSIGTFAIGVTQVTNLEYDHFVRNAPHSEAPQRNEPRFNDLRQPVVGVSWLDAASYCTWLGSVTGLPVRLPREAEWEFAARGGLEASLFPWGDEPPQTRAGYGERWLNGPERCGGGTPNGYGLFDVCENVHEWCSDWYAADTYARSHGHDPHGPGDGARRVSRGGSWRHRVKVSRCAARSSLPPDLHYNDYGFRIACDGT